MISSRVLLRHRYRCQRCLEIPQVLLALGRDKGHGRGHGHVKHAHESSKQHSSYSSTSTAPSTTVSEDTPAINVAKKASTSAPLSCLPLSSVLRSYLVTTVSSTPFLLTPALGILGFVARSKAPLLNPDVNPIVKFILRKTLYAQFCAGETPEEVRGAVGRLKSMGFKGVILGYGREVVMEEEEASGLGEIQEKGSDEGKSKVEVEEWKEGTLETVRLADEGDFVALKFSGAGSEALRLLAGRKEPTALLAEAIEDICGEAAQRKVRLLFDAEQAVLQDGIDGWTLGCMQRFNRGEGGALVYGTYQAYRRSTPETLGSHLEAARKGGFTLGVKLVRGAYLGSDARELFWGTKEETDSAYDGIAEAVMRRRYGGLLRDVSGEGGEAFPEVDLVLASHNRRTVEKARAIRDGQVEGNERTIRLVFGQLMGMADEISCELVQAGKQIREEGEAVDVPRAYKYLVWGTVGECTKYLLRRAQENRDAVSRTRDGRIAMGKELRRRLVRTLTFGMSSGWQ
jgi:proline dehydrogenase